MVKVHKNVIFRLNTGEKFASPRCNTLKTVCVATAVERSAVDGIVLQVSPSLQPSIQIQDLLLVMTVVDNSLQELAPSVPHEDSQEVEEDRSSYVVPRAGDSIINALIALAESECVVVLNKLPNTTIETPSAVITEHNRSFGGIICYSICVTFSPALAW